MGIYRQQSMLPSLSAVVYIFLFTEQPLKSLLCKKDGTASVTLPKLRSQRSVGDNQREYSNHLEQSAELVTWKQRFENSLDPHYRVSL
jgi:hypothetical protein